MISIERTTDPVLIKAIVTRPEVYTHISDDMCPPSKEWEPPIDDSVIYLYAECDGVTLGIWVLTRENSICKKVHTCLLPSSYGSLSREAAAAMLRWVWENTDCLRVITDVPSYNRIALKYALDCGLDRYGLNPKSYLKNGKLFDQVLLGISKPE